MWGLTKSWTTSRLKPPSKPAIVLQSIIFSGDSSPIERKNRNTPAALLVCRRIRISRVGGIRRGDVGRMDVYFNTMTQGTDILI